jgi:hypothetical protein
LPATKVAINFLNKENAENPLKKYASRKPKRETKSRQQKYKTMDDVPLCPDWWPLALWQLHFTKIPWPGPGNPVNYPPAINAILSALLAHSSSYLLLDQKAGAAIRAEAVKSIASAAENMDKLHSESNEK